MIRSHWRILMLAVSVWNDKYKNILIAETPVDELRNCVLVAKELKDKILQSQIDCESIPDLQELRNSAGVARTGFLQFIASANKEI